MSDRELLIQMLKHQLLELELFERVMGEDNHLPVLHAAVQLRISQTKTLLRDIDPTPVVPEFLG